MADEALNYEGMLSALQGLIGEEVLAFIELRYDSGLRPLGMLRGILSSAQDTDLSEGLEGRVLRYPGGEAFFFFVGTEHSWFVVRRDDFKFGRRKGRALSFETGRAQTYISPFPPD